MSLVGNIEDLGLGEILQIVSLGRRSGVLSLKSRGSEARIVFRNGLVTRATSSSCQQNLGKVLVHKGVIDRTTLNRALTIQTDEGYRQLLGTIMVERFGVGAEAIEEVVREQIENVVYSVFSWTEGTFEFEMQETPDDVDPILDPLQFMLKQGLNPQFLAMEGARIYDERRHRGELEEGDIPSTDAVAGPPSPVGEFILDPAFPPPPPKVAESIEATAWVVMALGGAALVYGGAGLANYYGRNWQVLLSQPDLPPVSKISVFFRLGFIPWTVTLASLYLIWAAHNFRRLAKGSLHRLIRGARTGVAVAVIYEIAEFADWMRFSSSTPSLSFYVVGIFGSLFWAAVLSAPFAGLLLYLKSEGMSRELGKALRQS